MSLKASRIVIAVFLAALAGTAGAVFFPDTLRLAGPVVCPGGESNVRTHGFRSGTEGGVEVTLTCAPPGGEPYEVAVPLVALVCAAEAFLPLLLVAFLLPPIIYRPFMSSGPASPSGDNVDAEARLADLKKVYDEGLITQKEYDDKRKEILKGM